MSRANFGHEIRQLIIDSLKFWIYGEDGVPAGTTFSVSLITVCFGGGRGYYRGEKHLPILIG